MLFDENFNFLEKLIYSISCLSLTLSKLLPFLPKMAQCVGFLLAHNRGRLEGVVKIISPPTTHYIALYPAWTLNVLVHCILYGSILISFIPTLHCRGSKHCHPEKPLYQKSTDYFLRQDNKIYYFQDCIQNRTIFRVMKVDIFLSISDFCFLGRRQIYLCALF